MNIYVLIFLSIMFQEKVVATISTIVRILARLSVAIPDIPPGSKKTAPGIVIYVDVSLVTFVKNWKCNN